MAVLMPPQPAGFNAKGYVSSGTGREFQTWRRTLLEMAPMLSRSNQKAYINILPAWPDGHAGVFFYYICMV